jgi:hypothetical protein
LKVLLAVTRGAIPVINHLRDDRELCSPAGHYAGLHGPGTQQIAFVAESSGELAPTLARIDLRMAFFTG